MKNHFTLLIITLLFFAACKPAVKPEDLYGKWKYIKVAKLDEHSTDTVTMMTLREQVPYLQITKDSLIINWDHQILSHGTYRVEGRNIQYKEILGEGKTREFPFYVTELTDKRIIFSTKGAGWLYGDSCERINF